MAYKFLEDVATADIAFRASGRSREELFIAAADATTNVMVEELSTVMSKEKRRVRLENEEVEMLLFDFLQ